MRVLTDADATTIFVNAFVAFTRRISLIDVLVNLSVYAVVEAAFAVVESDVDE